MRFLLLVLAIAFPAIALQAQRPDNSPEATIRDALNPRSDFYGSGIMDKQLSRMGDAAAVAITKVLAGKNVEEATIERILVILRTAFSAPQIVENESDRQPHTALFVLRFLESQSSNASQRKRIRELSREFKEKSKQ